MKKLSAILLIPAILIALLSTSACKKKNLQKVKVQFINASVHSPYLDYYLQGSKRAEFIGYTLNTNSHTAELEAGEPLVIQIKNPATGEVVAGGSYTNWRVGRHYTFVMYHDYAVRKTTLLSDSVDWPAPGKFKVRFMHFSNEAPALDLFFNNDTIGFNRTYFATDSTTAIDSIITLTAATYTVTLKNHLTGQTYLSLPGMGISDNRILDVYAVGTFSDSVSFPLQLGWAAH
ncbi:MAG: DUF4397 domain-containing protein [Chitinophagales bacterium]|nr:DUF4397 domain-containing protein [Chitinophagales bacterium]